MAFDRWVNSGTAFAMLSHSGISILSSEPGAALAADRLGMFASLQARSTLTSQSSLPVAKKSAR
jgi:hypothetical protein